MVRTQQSARKSTGGKAPRVQLAQITPSGPLAHERATDATEAEREDASLEEALLLATSKAAVLESRSVTSTDRMYFETILLLHRMTAEPTTSEDDVAAVITAATALEAKNCRARATRLRHRLHLFLLERNDVRAYDYLAKELQLHCTAVMPEHSEHDENDTTSSTVTFDVGTIIRDKVCGLVRHMTKSGSNELTMRYLGVGVLSSLTPLTRESIFRNIVRGDDYGFSAAQKNCVLQTFVAKNLLQWTDFPEYIDFLGAQLASLDIDDITIARTKSFRLSITQLDTLLERHESLTGSAAFALQYVATLRSAFPDPSQERDYLRAALASLDRFRGPKTLLRFALLHHLLREVQYSSNAASILRAYAAIARAAPYASSVNRLGSTVHDVVFFDSASRSMFPGATTATYISLDDITTQLGLRTISQVADETLLKRLLTTLLPSEPDLLADLAPFLDAALLETQHTIAMLSSGRGTRAEFEGRLLDADVRREVFESADVRFAESNPETFAPGAPVALRLLVKNTPAITVQLFELNVTESLRRTFTPIRSNVSLEGLLPNEECTVRFDGVPSHVRTEHVVEFTSLSAAHRGVFVVEVVGANIACRAVVRKGHLRFVTTCSRRGHEFRAFDEAQAPVMDFEVAVRDPHNAVTVTTVASSPSGVAVLPYFSARDDAVSVPPQYPMYLGVAGFGVLGTFTYCEEAYDLRAQFGIDAEHLVPGARATVLLHAVLYLNGTIVPVSLLQSAQWTIESTSPTGTVTRSELRHPPRFSDTADVAVTIYIPKDAVSLQLTVAAAVAAPAGTSARASKLRRVEHTQSFALHRSTAFADGLFAVHLQRIGDDFALVARGHNGEPVAHALLDVGLQHTALAKCLESSAVTNAQGQVLLGPLADVTTVHATTKSGARWSWPVPGTADHSWLERLIVQRAPPVHAVVGETAVLPLPSCAEAALLDWLVRGWITIVQHFDHLADSARVATPQSTAATVAVGDGASLAFVARVAGKYAVVLKPLGVEVTVCVATAALAVCASGVRVLVNGDTLVAAPTTARPVTVAAFAASPAAVTVALRQATSATRVHVVIKRFVGLASAGTLVGTLPQTKATTTTEAYPPTDYFESKRISDEYAYVLGRRAYAHAHPASALLQGSLLPCPTLLLHPYAVDETESQRLADTKKGEAYTGPVCVDTMGGGRKGRKLPFKGRRCPRVISPMPNTAFLADASIVVANLVPNSEGVVELPLSPLRLVGAYEIVVLAVDGETVAWRQGGLEASADATPLRDMRLASAEALGSSPDAHFVQVRGQRCLVPGASIELPCVAAAKVEVYDTLEQALRLMDAITGRSLRLHDFLTAWSGLAASRKAQLYDEHASDELNVYLLKKDPAFFHAAVAPHIEAKVAKSFVDHYVLGHTAMLLAIYNSPVQLERLTIVEMLLLAERLPAPEAEVVIAYVVRVLENYKDESTQTKLSDLFEHVLVAKNDANADFAKSNDKLLEIAFDDFGENEFCADSDTIPEIHRSNSEDYDIRHCPPDQKAPLNKELQAHYETLCAKLALLPALSSLHRLVLAAFLVTFHRVDAAIAVFADVTPADVPALQYDYMAAYLDFFGPDAAFPTARAAVAKYEAYTDARWRGRFAAIGEQLMVLDTLGQRGGAAEKAVDDIGVVLTVHRDHVEIAQKGRRVSHAEVRFYPVDVEVLFSTEPFGATTAQSSAVALVQPRAAVTVAVAPHGTTTVEIPAELRALQMMVVLAPRGFPELNMTQPHFCDSMDVDVVVEDGRLQVFAAGQPLTRTYVKVFAQTKASAKVRFYKDGYTDVVGCFDYIGINDTKLLLQVKALAVLIVHPVHGAVVRQLRPPPAIVCADDADML
ncbi:hypothetical protein ACHHYP_00511 [Achlya hypogyna]|uniref:Uncharacterized protein n=1 Tax=Achlya hypogyna TaxID=1202772 RepID=A0A1V9ZUJ2_ACHHY|nr:hypothetical protein ACHHYP_00511 [Achlya hypogyna]